jgi:hypothetical protein
MHHGTEVCLPKTLAVAVKEGNQGISNSLPAEKTGRPERRRWRPWQMEQATALC